MYINMHVGPYIYTHMCVDIRVTSDWYCLSDIWKMSDDFLLMILFSLLSTFSLLVLLMRKIHWPALLEGSEHSGSERSQRREKGGDLLRIRRGLLALSRACPLVTGRAEPPSLPGSAARFASACPGCTWGPWRAGSQRLQVVLEYGAPACLLTAEGEGRGEEGRGERIQDTVCL